jgi:hypothetical protein
MNKYKKFEIKVLNLNEYSKLLYKVELDNILLITRFNYFVNEFKEILIDFLDFDILDININYLFLNGFIKHKKINDYYYFSTLNLKEFKFNENNIYLKKVSKNKDYYSLGKFNKFDFLNLYKVLNP